MSAAPLLRVIAFRLVTQRPAALARFYADALGARIAGVEPLAEGGERTSLMVGAQRIELDAFAEPGGPYPDDLAADDLRFQHCAFVVADIAAVHRRALACGAAMISHDGPVTLPASSGGVTAVKLRDPEGHPFELLAFPDGDRSDWDKTIPNAHDVRGIDHSAISVADSQASAAFYARHGLDATGAGINQGPTQAALDGLDAPVVDVVPLQPSGLGPHLELLGYRGERRSAAPVGPHDVVATRILWQSDRDGVLIDPDGHRHELVKF